MCQNSLLGVLYTLESIHTNYKTQNFSLSASTQQVVCLFIRIDLFTPSANDALGTFNDDVLGHLKWVQKTDIIGA